jgi:hypothetical protein
MLNNDEATASQHVGDPITIGKHPLARDDLLAVLGKRLDTLPLSVREPTRIAIGTYRGLSFGVIVHPSFPPDVYLEGAITRTSGLSKDHQGPRAVLNALERLADGYAPECERVRRDLGIAESQHRDYQDRLGKAFTHEGYLTELTGLRDHLKSKLSASGHDSTEDRGPTTGELAERIKALKASNTIEGPQQRTERKHSTAEEPITARILRRQKESVMADHAFAADSAPGAADAAHPAQEETPPVKPMTFQDRISLERQQKNEGQSLN